NSRPRRGSVRWPPSTSDARTRAMATVFFTGFPGQLGSELVPRVLLRPAGDEAICLVEPKFVETARDEVRQIVADDPSVCGRVRVLTGDITREDLGLGRTRVSKGEI